MLATIRSKVKRKLKAMDTEERCGLILADGSVFQSKNIHPNPERAFMVAPEDLVEHEDNLFGTWHTHPNQPAALSQEDYSGFCQWPTLTHFIVGTDGVRAYRVVEGVIEEVSLAAN